MPDHDDLKPFKCAHCGAVFGSRSGDVMIAEGFAVEFKRRHKIRCTECGRDTAFALLRDKFVDKENEKVFNS